MKKIWKYPVPLHGEFELELPEESSHLCIMEQDDSPYMWMTIPDDQKNIKKYKYKVLQTGEYYDEDKVGQYIGTFQLSNRKEAHDEAALDGEASCTTSLMSYYVGHLFRRGF